MDECKNRSDQNKRQKRSKCSTRVSSQIDDGRRNTYDAGALCTVFEPEPDCKREVDVVSSSDAATAYP